MQNAKLTEAQPDIEVEVPVLGGKVYVWQKSPTTVRVTILVGGHSRVFEATKTHIRERRLFST